MIHQYKLGKFNIVIDVCSGAVHAVDDVAFEVIALFENNDKKSVVKSVYAKFESNPDVTIKDVEECYDQVQALKDKGKLFSPDTLAYAAIPFSEYRSDSLEALGAVNFMKGALYHATKLTTVSPTYA